MVDVLEVCVAPVSSSLSFPSATHPPSARPIATAANNVPRGRGPGLPVPQNGHDSSSVTKGRAQREQDTSLAMHLTVMP